jgi:gas vesicle protein
MIRFLTGFWIGALIGAVAVILTTPQSGSDLQESVRHRIDDVLAEGRKAAEWRRAELEARLADLRAGL